MGKTLSAHQILFSPHKIFVESILELTANGERCLRIRTSLARLHLRCSPSSTTGTGPHPRSHQLKRSHPSAGTDLLQKGCGQRHRSAPHIMPLLAHRVAPIHASHHAALYFMPLRTSCRSSHHAALHIMQLSMSRSLPLQRNERTPRSRTATASTSRRATNRRMQHRAPALTLRLLLRPNHRQPR